MGGSSLAPAVCSNQNRQMAWTDPAWIYPYPADATRLAPAIPGPWRVRGIVACDQSILQHRLPCLTPASKKPIFLKGPRRRAGKKNTRTGQVGRYEIRNNNSPWTALGIVRVSKQTHETVPVGWGEGGGREGRGRAGSSHICYVYILYITFIIHPHISTQSLGFSNEPSLVSDYPRPTLPLSHTLVSPQ